MLGTCESNGLKQQSFRQFPVSFALVPGGDHMPGTTPERRVDILSHQPKTNALLGSWLQDTQLMHSLY